MTEPLLTVDDVAAKLQCSPRKAREIILKLPHVRVGKLLRVLPDVLDAWTRRGGDDYGEAPRARVRRPPPPQRASLPTTIASALRVPVAKRRAA